MRLNGYRDNTVHGASLNWTSFLASIPHCAWVDVRAVEVCTSREVLLYRWLLHVLRRMCFYDNLLHHEIVWRKIWLIMSLLVLQDLQATCLHNARFSIRSVNLNLFSLDALVSAELIKWRDILRQLFFLEDNAFFKAEVALNCLFRLLIVF